MWYRRQVSCYTTFCPKKSFYISIVIGFVKIWLLSDQSVQIVLFCLKTGKGSTPVFVCISSGAISVCVLQSCVSCKTNIFGVTHQENSVPFTTI